MQRQALGLPEAPTPSTQPLEIQAYDELCVSRAHGRKREKGRPATLLGALTLELPTDADDEVLAWIAAGTPPMRAGVPALVLWTALDQPIWAGVIEHLKVGAARGFSVSNQASLVSDLRSILSPQCVTRARQVAASMTKAAESVARAADLLEDAARPQDAPGRRAD